MTDTLKLADQILDNLKECRIRVKSWEKSMKEKPKEEKCTISSFIS